MWNKLYSLVAFTAIITANQSLAAAPCLDDVTDAAKDFKACLMKQSTSNDCSEQSRHLEIKKLICEREGADQKKIKLSVDIGNLMVAGELEDAPITELITKAVVTEINMRLPSSDSYDLERRLRTIEERLKAIDASRAAVNAELLKVQGQVNGLMLDRTFRK